MTKEVARITRDGDLLLNGVIREGVSPVDTNLIHDFDLMSDCVVDRRSSNGPMAAAKETIMRSYNLLDSMDIDWRDPQMWSGGGRDTTYDAHADCIVFTNSLTVSLLKGIPVIHDLKFNISCEVYQDPYVKSDNPPLTYFGGKITDEANHSQMGEQIPGYWDYLCIEGQKLPVGQWKFFHNSANGGNPRSGTDGNNKTDNAWVSKKAQYYYPLMLANYSGENGDTVKIRNIRVWYSDDDSKSRNLQTGAGIQIANGSQQNYIKGENLGIDGTIEVANSRNRAIISATYLPDGSTGTKWSCMPSNINPSEWDGVSGTWAMSNDRPIAGSGGQWWTATMLIRASDWERVSSNMMRLKTSKSAYSLFNNARKISVGDGWYLCYGSVLLSEGEFNSDFSSYSYGTNDTYQIEFGRATLVKGRNVLSLPPNAITVDDGLSIKTRSLESFTVMGKFINSRRIVEAGDYSQNISNQAILFSLLNKDGNALHFRYYQTSEGKPYPFVDPDPKSKWHSGTSGHIHNYVSMANGATLYWVAKHHKGQHLYVQFYNEDGTKHGETHELSGLSDDLTLEHVVLGWGSNNWQAIHSELKVYNKYINNPEITDLIKTRFVVEDGECREDFMEHRNIDAMVDIDMSPYESSVYGEGWAVVSPTNNYLPENTWDGWHMSIKGLIVDTPYGEGIKISGVNSMHTKPTNDLSGNYRYIDVPKSNFKVGDKITFSMWCYLSDDWDGGNWVFRSEGVTGGLDQTTDATNKGRWKLITKTVTYTQAMVDSTRTHIRCLTYNNFHRGTKGHMILADARVVKKSKPSIKDELNPTRMDFNLNKDYKLDQREDWTVSYWKKPISDHIGGDDAYSIDSLGHNGGKRAGGGACGYMYWGKNNKANDIVGSESIPDMSKYWDHWRLIVVSHKKGDGLYITEVDEMKTYRRKARGSIPYSDYYTNVTETANGRDLKIGGWHSSYCTSIFRDLKFGRVYKDQSQIEAMFKEGLRVTKDGISINGEVVEGTL